MPIVNKELGQDLKIVTKIKDAIITTIMLYTPRGWIYTTSVWRDSIEIYSQDFECTPLGQHWAIENHLELIKDV